MNIQPELVPAVAQYGVAGMMGVLWFLERRHSSQRERELTEAHGVLMEQRAELSELIGVVKENSVAMTGLEKSQGRLSGVCEEIACYLRSRRVREGRARVNEGEL